MNIMPQHTQRDISTATQAPTLQHRPWCDDHATPDPNDPSGTGFCSRTVDVGQVGVELADDDEGTVILLWPGTDRRVTPEQAREIAAELIRAAETVEQSDTESHRPATSGSQPINPATVSVSVADAAAMTSFSQYDIRNAINRGELPAVQHGKQIAVKVDELRQWVDTLEPA